MSEALVDTPPDPPQHHVAVVIPFPVDRRRTALAEARRRHPSARTG